MSKRKIRQEVSNPQSWKDIADVLSVYALDCHPGVRRVHGPYWFFWTVELCGDVVIVPFAKAEMLESITKAISLQVAAAIHGRPVGMGVWTAELGTVALAVYTPPAWPEVVREDGTRHTVDAAWPADELMGDTLREAGVL